MTFDRPANPLKPANCWQGKIRDRCSEGLRRALIESIGTSMQATFDERNWLSWLVKVRILILTLLLGIQLAIAQLTPTRLPLRLFLSTILLWYTVSLFYVLLLSLWKEHRLQASLQVLTDLIMVSLVV